MVDAVVDSLGQVRRAAAAVMTIPLPAENVLCKGKVIRKICQGKLHSALILFNCFVKLLNWPIRSCLVALNIQM